MSYFTLEEVALLRARYATDGPAKLAREMGRKTGDLVQKAAALGILPPAINGRQFSEEEDRQIIRRWPAISRHAGTDSSKKLAREIGCSIHQLRRRAAHLGLKRHRVKEPPWTEDESELLMEHVHLSLPRLAQRLTAAGFPRTEAAVATQRARLNASVCQSTNAYSASQLALLMGCGTSLISRWIARGWLKATPRSDVIDVHHGGVGDRWNITPAAVRDFITTYVGHIDIAAANKFWLVDTLRGSGPRPVMRQDSAGFAEDRTCSY